MKKLVTILSLVVTSTLLYGQGSVVFNSNNLGVLTNTIAVSVFNPGGTPVGNAASGKTAAFSSFNYALFVQTYTGTTPGSTNPLTSGWTLATSSGQPFQGTNGPSGLAVSGILGLGSAAGAGIDGLAQPTAGSYTDAGRDYFMIAGWSSNLGTTWSAVSSLLQSGFSTISSPGFFGVSTIGVTYGAGAFSLSPNSLFVVSQQVTTPVGAFTLYQVTPVPEPTTMALAGLGGLSLLLFRRRK